MDTGYAMATVFSSFHSVNAVEKKDLFEQIQRMNFFNHGRFFEISLEPPLFPSWPQTDNSPNPLHSL